jgi:hypothetical protein
MACVNHPDVPDVARCAQCRKRVCQDCYVMLEGRPLCGTCKDLVVRLVERGESVTSGERGPTPWEREKSFGTLLETVKAACLRPTEFFRSLSWQGDGHYTYLLAVGWLPTVVGTGVVYGVQGLAGLASGTREGAVTGVGFALGMILCLVIMVPLQLFMGLFVGGLIAHLCLRLVGGANAPLEATLRTLAYAQSAAVLNFVPFCGGVVSAGWGLVLQIIGLKEVHETTYGKVILAIFLPMIVCLTIVGGALALLWPLLTHNR